MIVDLPPPSFSFLPFPSPCKVSEKVSSRSYIRRIDHHLRPLCYRRVFMIARVISRTISIDRTSDFFSASSETRTLQLPRK